MASSRDIDRPGKPSAGSADAAGERPVQKRSPVWTVAGVAVLAAIVGSCCLCSGVLYRQWPQFEQDPEAAEALTREIISIEIPATFTPQGLIEWRVSFLLTMRGAYYSQIVSHGELTLLEIDSRFIEQPEFRRHIVESLHQHGAGSGFDLNVMRRETKAFQIGNEQVDFEFLTAEDRTTGRGRILVDGVVRGRRGTPVLISLWVDEEIWDAEQVTRMIESIGSSR